MTGRRVIVSSGPGEARALVEQAGAAIDLHIARASAVAAPGDLFLGRVVGFLPALPGALVDIGETRPAVLTEEDAVDLAPAGKRADGITAWLHEGEAITVQVVRAARDGKATGLTARLAVAGNLLAVTPTHRGLRAPPSLPPTERDRLLAILEPNLARFARETGDGAPPFGVRLLPAAQDADEAALFADLAVARARWQRLAARARAATAPALLADAVTPLERVLAEAIGTDGPGAIETITIDSRAGLAEARLFLRRDAPSLAERTTFDESAGPTVDATIEAALAPEVDLPGGGRLRLAVTPAVVLIDVDLGQRAGARERTERAALAVNLAAAEAIGRGLRLRNLAGPIVIDFVSMARPIDRAAVKETLVQALAGDSAPSQILGWTRLGHLEMTRQRRGIALAELLVGPAPAPSLSAESVAYAALRSLGRAADASPGTRLGIAASPAVIASLVDGPAAPARILIEARLGVAIALTADPAQAQDGFDIRPISR